MKSHSSSEKQAYFTPKSLKAHSYPVLKNSPASVLHKMLSRVFAIVSGGAAKSG